MGRRGENSAEGPRFVHLEAEDGHDSLSLLVPILWKVLQSPWEAVFLGKGNVILLPSVFDFELTPENMKAIDGINRNIRYYEFLL